MKRKTKKRWLEVRKYAIGAAFTALMYFIVQGRIESAERVACARHLELIWNAATLYAADDLEHGHFPASFIDLAGVSIEPQTWSCPGASVPGAAPADANFDYIGRGSTVNDPSPTTTIVAYDSAGNHDSRWANLLFADGHVEGVKLGRGESLERVIAERGWSLYASRTGPGRSSEVAGMVR